MANEATKLTINGVQHDIKDAEARRLIALLQAALDAMTGTGTTTAIETFQEVLDFLAGVTDDETLVGKITALQTAINGKVDKEAGKGLSTEDFTAALKAKLEALDPYTKAEVNAAIQEAVEGLGGGSVESVTINGQTKTPDSQGNVDLGTVVGQQGPQGNVAITDAGQIVTIIENNLDSSDGNAILSARQGKILKQAISVVQANLQAVVDALANMAFTELPKPTLSQIDWTGGTFYATVVKNLTGCTATDNTTNGQIVEGQTLTMELTADSGFTLTGATISVTNSKGQSVAYTLNGSTLTVANVTGTITVSVVAVAIYSVVNNDTNVNLTANTMSPTSGSSWTGTLAIKSGISNYRLASAPVVTMGGTAVDFSASGNSWDSTTGVMTIGNVTGNIVITSASVESVSHAVRNHLLNMSTSNNATQVEDGDSYTADITADSGATSWDDLRVQVGGTDVTSQCTITDITGGKRLVIPAAVVTGNIDIVAAAYTDIVEIKTTADEGTTVKIKGNGSDWNSSTITALVAGDTHEPTDGVFTLAANDTIRFAVHDINEITIGTKTAIKSIDFGGAKVSVQASQFEGFSNIESFTGMIPRGWRNTTYANYLFKGCTSLRSIDLAHFTISITDCLRNCTALESVQVHGFAKGGFPGMLVGCTSIEAVDFTDLDRSTSTSPGMPFGNNPSLKSVDMRGCKFDSATSFSSTVSGLFNGLTALEEVHIDWNTPALTTLFDFFRNTTSMKTLDIGKWRAGQSLTSMQNAFSGCKATRIDISGFSTTSSLTTIADAFRECTNLEELVIGDFNTSELTNAGAFYQAKAGLSVICTTTTPPAVNTQNNWLSGLPSGSTIYVPDSAVDAYRSAAGWSDYASKIKSINEKA